MPSEDLDDVFLHWFNDWGRAIGLVARLGLNLDVSDDLVVFSAIAVVSTTTSGLHRFSSSVALVTTNVDNDLRTSRNF